MEIGAEQQQRFSLSPMIGEPAAGIGVNRAEQSLQRIEQADDQNAAAERLDIFGREAEPEFFAGAGQQERDEQQRGVAPEREEFGNIFPAAHASCAASELAMSCNALISAAEYSCSRTVPMPKRADDFSAVADGHAQRAADAGLFRAGPGDAAGVGLQIADRHGPVFRDGFAGDAFADGNGFDDFEQLRRQADLRDEMQQLRWRIEPVNRAGFGMKLGERVAQNLFKRFVHCLTINTLQCAWSLMRSAVSPSNRPQSSEWSLWPMTIKS